jgi:hypothetical protein
MEQLFSTYIPLHERGYPQGLPLREGVRVKGAARNVSATERQFELELGEAKCARKVAA